MRTEIDRISSLLRGLYEGEAWHGRPLLEILEDITAAEACYRPAAGLHNIAELVAHLTNWRVFALEKLTGSVSYDIILDSEEDWPEINSLTTAQWRERLDNLQESQQELLDTLGRLPSSHKLGETVPGRRYNFYTLLHGLLHHDVYHSGQIMQLRKQYKTVRPVAVTA